MDTYNEPKTMTFPNMTVRVYRPELTPAERERRMNTVRKAVINLLRSAKK